LSGDCAAFACAPAFSTFTPTARQRTIPSALH
jgi:hypothetical protein